MFSKNTPFSDNPIMSGYDNRLFEFNEELGYNFHNNQLIGNKSFISYNKKIDEIRKNDKSFLVLNLGDSSTSGWNSDNIYMGCLTPADALFSYKTYSDILEEKFQANVINAGIPGFTTYQAKKQLAKMLKDLARDSMYVDYITCYLGNNDCTFNGCEDKARIDYKVASKNNVLTRVSEKDFLQNYSELLHIISEYGAKPIIIIPATNFTWQPGLRSKKYPAELTSQLEKVIDKKIKNLFGMAELAFQSGEYALAIEKDLLLPRIKNSYKLILQILAKNIDFIDTQSFIKSEDDFIDYCHPGEEVNAKIASAINGLLMKKNKKYKQKFILQDIPNDTYTLY